MPWIVLTVISLVLDVLNILASLISLLIPTVITGLLFLGIAIYFFICVWSFR